MSDSILAMIFMPPAPFSSKTLRMNLFQGGEAHSSSRCSKVIAIHPSEGHRHLIAVPPDIIGSLHKGG